MNKEQAQQALASCKTSQEREAIIKQLLNAEHDATSTHTGKLAYSEGYQALSYEQLSKQWGIK